MGGILTSTMKSKEDEALRQKLGMTSKQVQDVMDSWNDVKEFGTEKTGILLFKRFFKVQPETFNMFEDFKDIKDWENSAQFKHHCKIVMNIVGAAVGLLKDPESLDSTLEYLGLKHQGFNITKEHFDIMGVELMGVLREALGSKFTPDKEQAWMCMYAYVTKVIMVGMDAMEAGIGRMMESS
eukprot:gene34763-42097_t